MTETLTKTITEQTRELLVACRDAGYEAVALLCVDKRVPQTLKFQKSRTSYQRLLGDYRLCCGMPHLTGGCSGRKGDWPLMWGIIKDLGLNSKGEGYGGENGDCFPISKVILDAKTLTPGCYELADMDLSEPEPTGRESLKDL